MSEKPMPDDATPLPGEVPEPGHEYEVLGGERDIPPDGAATPLI
ncbi:hypothetical protein ACIP6T_23710 [Pantoea sp. NPDC088449]